MKQLCAVDMVNAFTNNLKLMKSVNICVLVIPTMLDKDVNGGDLRILN